MPPLSDAACPLPQSPAYVAALAALGRRAEVISLSAGGTVLATLARVRIPGIGGWFASRGPVWSEAATPRDRQDALAVLRRDGMRLLNATAEDAPRLARAGYYQVMTGATLAELPLDTAWRDRLTGKWRNALRKAEADQRRNRLILGARPFDPARDAWVLRAQAQHARTKRYRPLPAAFTAAFATASPGAAHLFEARQDGHNVAALLFLRHGTMATYHLAWSSAAGDAAGAHRLLLAKALPWLVAHGHRRLDLGLLDTERAPGLARFKLGLGAEAVPLGGTWIKGPRRATAPRPTRLVAQHRVC